jgi:hypothetical protein
LKNSGRTPITFISKKRAGIGVRDYIDKTINKAVLKLRFQHFAQNSLVDVDFEKKSPLTTSALNRETIKAPL